MRCQIHFPQLCSAILLFTSLPAAAQTPTTPINPAATSPQAEVLILGSYHMDNPGLDLHNTKADDVLTPKRQAEIEELASVLARFHPTKIAVEWDSGSQPALDRSFNEYLSGNRQLTRDERQQVAMRLAKSPASKSSTPSTPCGIFPTAPSSTGPRPTVAPPNWKPSTAWAKRKVRPNQEFLRDHTVLEMFRRMNSPEYVAANGAFYARFGHFGDDNDPAGARLLTRWYERNTFILTSLLGILEPGDRVLVLYGAGHETLLRRFISDDPTLRLRTLDDLLSHTQ